MHFPEYHTLFMELIKRVLGFHKTPPVLVDAFLYELECIVHDVVPPKGRRLYKRLCQMKNFLLGKGDSDPLLEECEELANCIINKRVVLRALLAFSLLQVQERTLFVHVFSILLHRNYAHFAYDYMLSQEGNDIIMLLIRLFDLMSCVTVRYSSCDVCIHTGTMLRECIRCHGIHESMLSQPKLIEPLLCRYPFSHQFDVSCDVMFVIRDLLRRHRTLVAALLNPNGVLFSYFFFWMIGLIQSENYIVVRLSLQLLYLLLQDKQNISIALAVLSQAEALMGVMNCLCSAYKSIQIEAFHVFKLFVINSKRSLVVTQLLLQNKNQFEGFFATFLCDYDDETFLHEKQVVVSMLTAL